VFGTGIYYMLKMMKKGPAEGIESRESLKYPGLHNRTLDAVVGE
jgi:cytochrome bd ubiquinol oxidase subunit I